MIVSSFDPLRPYPGHTWDYGFPRVRAIRAALPDIADRPQQGVVVLGSSGVARAFVPSAFDAAYDGDHGRSVSFNLGQLMLQPETALAMSKVIRQTYEARGKRIGIVIFSISIAELSHGAVRAARNAMPDQSFAFTTLDGLSARAHADPSGAITDAVDYGLFGNVRPDRVGLWVEDWWNANPTPCDSGMHQPPDTAEEMSALVAYCHELDDQFPRGKSPWNPNTRGGLDFGLPATRPMLESLVSLQHLPPAEHPPDAPVAAHGPSLTVPDDTDEGAIRTMVAALHELTAVSDHTFVLRDIMNPTFVASLPPALLERWREIAERIARDGGASLLDFNDGTFVPRDFGDRTHLHPIAAQRFSTLLGARMRLLLGDHRASR
jgi:hypothetical protein